MRDTHWVRRFNTHERCAEALDLVVSQISGLDPPQGLALHELPEQLHHRSGGSSCLRSCANRVRNQGL